MATTPTNNNTEPNAEYAWHDDDCIDPDCFGDCDLWRHSCKFCGEPITEDGQGAWIDRTEGDVCSGDDNLVNENEGHVPAQIDSSGAQDG